MSSSSGNKGANCDHSKENLVETGDVLWRICNTCQDAIFGVGTCLKSNDGSKYFHEICVSPKPNLQHSFYPAVNFNFSRGLGNAERQRCVACYQDIKGCLYVGNNEIYIHPFCLVNLKESASNGDIEYQKQQMGRLLENYDSNGCQIGKCLKLECQMSLSDKVECIACKQADTESPGFGWAYKYTYTVGGASKNFECHVACLRSKVNKYFKIQIIKKYAGSTSEGTYFLELGRSGLDETARGVVGFALPVAIAGLDLMISAFVGAPLVSLALSLALDIGADKVESMFRRPRGN